MTQGNSHIFEIDSQTLANGKLLRLPVCKICGGTPGKKLGDTVIARSLTSECSGSKHTTNQMLDICDGKLDFRGGRWIQL